MRQKKRNRTDMLLRMIPLICVLFFCSFLLVEAGEISSVLGDALALTIIIEEPIGWHKEPVDIEVKANISNNVDYVVQVEAKTEKEGAWQDISQDMRITIYENCTVYVQVTDNKGNVYLKNKYIECFDREPPVVSGWVEGGLLNVEAYDNISGVAAININDYEVSVDECDDPVHGTTEVLLQNYIDPNSETIDIYAVDKAGNISSVYSIKNINFSGSLTGNVIGQQAEQSDSVTPIDGSGTVLENSVKTPDEREFYTIETKKGNIFYIMVDKQKQSDNVYLLVEAKENDLLGFVGTEEAAEENPGEEDIPKATSPPIIEWVNPSEKEPTPSEVAKPEEPEPTPKPEEEPEPQKSGIGIGTIILLFIVLIGVGGGGYYLKIYRPKKQLDDAEDFESFDFVNSQQQQAVDTEDNDFLYDDDDENSDDEPEDGTDEYGDSGRNDFGNDDLNEYISDDDDYDEDIEKEVEDDLDE